MKKLFVFAVLSLLCAQVQAQSLLNKLKDKASEAVESKISGKIDSALGIGNSKSSDAEQGTTVDMSSYMTYAKELLDPEDNPDYFDSDDAEDTPVTKHFTSYMDAIKARPALPAKGKLATEDDLRSFAAVIADVRHSTNELCINYAKRQSDLSRAALADDTSTSPSTAGSPAAGTASMITPQEVFTAINEAGLDPQTATEDQIKDAVATYMAKKKGLTKQQVLDMMSQAAAEEASKPRSRTDEIKEQLDSIYMHQADALIQQANMTVNMLQTAIMGGRVAQDESTMSGALASLKKKIIAAWPKSDECKAVAKMEADLSAKIDDWMRKNNKGWNDAMPSFWTEGRQEQNKIIDKWNAKQLDRWLETMARFYDNDTADAKVLAALDEELEAMSAAEKARPSWAGAKSTAVTLNGLILNYMDTAASVFDCPLVQHTSTEGAF